MQLRDFHPIVYVAQVGPLTDDDLEEYFELATRELEFDLELGRKSISIYDGSRGTVPTIVQRQRQAKWLRENHALIATASLGTAMYIPSRVVRGVLTALWWFVEPATPLKVEGSLEDALSWALELAERSELRVPPMLVRSPARALKRWSERAEDLVASAPSHEADATRDER